MIALFCAVADESKRHLDRATKLRERALVLFDQATEHEARAVALADAALGALVDTLKGPRLDMLRREEPAQDRMPTDGEREWVEVGA